MKKTYLLLICFTFIGLILQSQTNLVVDGDFENSLYPCDYRAEIITIANPANDIATSDLIRYLPDIPELRRYTACFNNGFTSDGWNCLNESTNLVLPHDLSSGNLNYFGLFCYRNGSQYTNQEFAYLELNQTLDQNKFYELSFWARSSDLNNCNQITVNIIGDDQDPCDNSTFTYFDGTASACGYSANNLDSALPLNISGDWQKYTITLNNLPDDINNLIVFPSVVDNGGINANYLLVDDIEIHEIEEAVVCSESCKNENGSFEITEPCASNPFAFNNECVPNWLSINGSPDLCTSCLQTNPPVGSGGDHFAALGTKNSGVSNGCWNEALYMPLDLIAGQTYTLCFYHKTGSNHDLDPIEINVVQCAEPDGVQNSSFSFCSNLEIPSNHEVLYSKKSFKSENWIKETICFTALDVPNNGLLFYPEQHNSSLILDQFWLIDMVCIDEFEACQAITDLTACPAEGDFGYIAYDCPGEYFWEFDSPGATGLEFTSEEHSILLQATPGTYTVTFKGEEGCEIEHQWNILETCCQKPCEIPTGLSCENGQEGVSLDWTNIPSAAGYILTIIPNDATCGCESDLPPLDTLEIPVSSNNFTFIPEFDCFSWSVRTWCGADTESQASESSCFSFKNQDCFDPLYKDEEMKMRSISTNNLQAKLFIYPNPSLNDVIINYSIDKMSDVKIEIFDLQGKRVYFKLMKNSIGEDKLVWKPDNSISAGSFFIKVTSDSWSVAERLVLSR